MTARGVSDFGERLLRVINDYQNDSNIVDIGAFAKYSMWYLERLHRRIEAFVEAEPSLVLLRKLFPGNAGLAKTKQELYRDLYDAILSVATVLNTENSSIYSIASHLLEGSGFPEDTILQSECYQLVFQLVSWLIMLYNTPEIPSPNVFQLCLVDSTDPAKRLRSSSWQKFTCNITDDVISQPIRHLLSRFGDFVPHRASRRSLERNGTLYEDSIISSHLSYYTLTKVAHIRVEWVDALSLHLEFDERTSVLKLFRFPSFCAMLCIGRDSQSTIFSTLFCHSGSDDDSSSICNESANMPYSQDFFSEVLCSYRLVFGQHKRAYHSFRDVKPTELQRKFGLDPLLYKLCGNSCESQALYTQIDAPRVKTTYSVQKDFPCLGKRLLELQDFVNAQNPSDLATLWYDRRDVLRFYTFWAVVVVGGISIILSLMQTASSIAQVVKT